MPIPYSKIKSDPVLYADKLRRAREWRTREQIKKDLAVATKTKANFLERYPLWEELKDFLEPQEVDIIVSLFCLDNPSKKPTLQEVGDRIKMTRQGAQYTKDKVLVKLDRFLASSR